MAELAVTIEIDSRDQVEDSIKNVVMAIPICFDCCCRISDYLKAYHCVIIDLASLDLPEARRTIDFVGGSAYILGGMLQKAGANVFIAVSSHAEILGDLLDTSQSKEFIQRLEQLDDR